jgi:ketosteroid isomerase-like protein
MPAPDAILNVADQLFAAIERGDESELEQMFDDDIAVWRVGSRRDDEKARALRVLHWFIDVTQQRHYEILDRRVFSDGFVQQHVLHAAGRDGGSIALRVCIVIKLNADALISRIDEYFDPAAMAPLMT